MRGAWTHQLIDEQQAEKAKDAEDESDAKRSLLQSPSGELVRRHFRGLQVSMRGGCQWDGVAPHARRRTKIVSLAIDPKTPSHSRPPWCRRVLNPSRRLVADFPVRSHDRFREADERIASLDAARAVDHPRTFG